MVLHCYSFLSYLVKGKHPSEKKNPSSSFGSVSIGMLEHLRRFIPSFISASINVFEQQSSSGN